jgi:hypothetical protein
MKRSWGWILACLAGVCLLWSLGLQITIHPQSSSFEKHSVAWPREWRSLSSCRNLQVLHRGMRRIRAGPQEFFFAGDVFLGVEDVSPAGPPSLEYRGPPGRYGDPGRTVGLPVAMVAIAALDSGVNYGSHPGFSERLTSE